MTAVATKTRRTAPVTPTAATPDRAVAAALRDVAYVLQLTRRVKAEILDPKPAPVAAKA
jgi:hypothetical protein